MLNLLGKNQEKRQREPEPLLLELEELSIPIRLKVNVRARRMILRVHAERGEKGEAVVTMPPGVGKDTAMQFVKERTEWIQDQLEQAPLFIRFEEGAKIPFLGMEHMIRHQPGQRAPVIREGDVLSIGGRPEHLPRRLTSWLRKEARRHIESRVISLSEKIGKRHGRITIRDTRSRWGSCSSSGALSFSWRLIMAPEWVMEYVVAHEVAHLAEHNHSPAYWKVVASLNDNADQARDWLRQYGEALHHFG